MKTPAEILGKNANRLPQQSWTSATPTGDAGQADARQQANALPVETKALVNMLFARFMAIYGHKFKSCFETQDEIRIAKREWALSLRGYGEAELVAAIDHCKEQLAWMPTISEFLKILQEQGDRRMPGCCAPTRRPACMPTTRPGTPGAIRRSIMPAGPRAGFACAAKSRARCCRISVTTMG
ncbi:hypothetical protein [Marinobacterium aestuariivivens]|uniref:Uncharacterized protein n=1 Tax=Marinobacterium aestuariivivens TaxID=1698799 RepID=A0ABW1ZW38_9GAMM